MTKNALRRSIGAVAKFFCMSSTSGKVKRPKTTTTKKGARALVVNGAALCAARASMRDERQSERRRRRRGRRRRAMRAFFARALSVGGDCREREPAIKRSSSEARARAHR